jgi:hypothetical protein
MTMLLNNISSVIVFVMLASICVLHFSTLMSHSPQKCSLVWYGSKHGLSHIPTLHSWHFNFILICLKYRNCPFPGTSADGVRVVLYSQIFPHTQCVCYSPSAMASFTAFHAYQRNYPSVVKNAFLSVYAHSICYSTLLLSSYVSS